MGLPRFGLFWSHLNVLYIYINPSIQRRQREVQATPPLSQISPCSMSTLDRWQQQVGRQCLLDTDLKHLVVRFPNCQEYHFQMDCGTWQYITLTFYLWLIRIQPSDPDDLLWLRCNDWWHIWTLPWLQSCFLCRDHLLACNQDTKGCKSHGKKVKRFWQKAHTLTFPSSVSSLVTVEIVG